MSKTTKRLVISRSSLHRQLCQFAIQQGGWSRVIDRFQLKYGAYPDLSGLKLTPLGLRRIGIVADSYEMGCLRNFRGVNMPGGKFKGAHLPLVDFTAAFLNGSDFKETDLESARFVQASIRHADFVGADLTATVFSGADKPDAIFQEDQRGLSIV